jgi:Zn-dependent peptidase ImmA (M78 family)
VLVFQADRVGVDEVRGFSVPERPLPAVVVNLKDAYAARSFSLLHELAHIALNRGGVCLLEEAGAPRSDEDRVEAFCNHVAGAVMLPAAKLLAEPEVPARLHAQISDTAIDALATRYGASAESVLRRLVILGRVSRSFYQRKRADYEKRYEELRRRKRKGGAPSRARLAVARGGRLFTRKVLEAYDEERITTSDVADLLGERVKHLDRIRAELERMEENGEPA